MVLNGRTDAETIDHDDVLSESIIKLVFVVHTTTRVHIITTMHCNNIVMLYINIIIIV